MARACGGAGFKAEKPGELRDAIDQGLKAEGPVIIDCVVPADELPNVPHIDLEKAANYAKAKVKEAILGDRQVTEAQRAPMSARDGMGFVGNWEPASTAIG